MDFHRGGGARDAVLWLVSPFGRDGVLGRDSSSRATCWGDQGEAVALHIARASSSLPSTRGQGLVDRALPADSRGPSAPHSPRSCGLPDAIRAGARTHTRTHTCTRLPILSTSWGVRSGVAQRPPDTKPTSASTLQLKPPRALHSRGQSSAKSIMPQGTAPAGPSPACPLPGGPEGGGQWGLWLPTAGPSPSLARERTPSSCGLPGPIRAMETLPSTLGRSPVTCWGRSHNRGVERGQRTKCTNQDEAQGPGLRLRPAPGLTPLSSLKPCWPLGFGPATIKKQQQAGAWGAPGPGRTAACSSGGAGPVASPPGEAPARDGASWALAGAHCLSLPRCPEAWQGHLHGCPSVLGGARGGHLLTHRYEEGPGEDEELPEEGCPGGWPGSGGRGQ